MKLKVGDIVIDWRDRTVGKILDLWELPDGQKMATLINHCQGVHNQYVRARKPLRQVKC